MAIYTGGVGTGKQREETGALKLEKPHESLGWETQGEKAFRCRPQGFYKKSLGKNDRKNPMKNKEGK